MLNHHLHWIIQPRNLLLAASFTLMLSGPCARLNAEQPVPPTRMPQVNVTDQLLEEAPTGAYGAPEWTGDRRFSTTRVYLQQGPGDVGFEQWMRGRYYRDGSAENKFMSEIEIGLPYRFQLDLYENWVMNQNRKAYQDEVSFELRYALADWGKIPLNPTLYAEYAVGDRHPNTIEVKLLLGEDLAKRWHWGFNLSCEQGLSGDYSTEILAAQGISYTIIDEKLSAGMEMEFIDTTLKGSRNDPSVEFQLGPSIQWRPLPWAHIDLVSLFGTTGNSPVVEAFVIFGIDFGPREKKAEGYVPASLHGH